MTNSKKYVMSPEEKKMINRVAWGTFRTMFASNQIVMGGRNFGLAMWPALELFYKDEKRRIAAFHRHSSEFFNTHTVPYSMIAGIAAAMEKQNAELPEEDNIDAAISSVKAALMGPTAGIGDSLFYNIIRVVIAGVCIGLGKDGSILAPLLFVAAYGGLNAFCKVVLCRYGYVYGVSIIDEAFEGGIIPLITRAGSILGAIMVGTLVASNVKITFTFAPTINGAVMDLQKVLDSIEPGIMSLVLWAIVFNLLQKKKWKPMKVIYAIMGVCLLFAFIKLF